MKRKRSNSYPFKIKKMLTFHGMIKGYFIRLALKGIYTYEYPHVDVILMQKIEDSGFKFITLDESWFNRNTKRKSIIVSGVWLPTNEDLNLYRLMFGPVTESQIYEF